MGSVHTYSTAEGKRYLVRYRKPDNSQAAKRGFRTKREAEEYLASISVSITSGAYVDPTDARITVSQLGQDWLLEQKAVLKPSSMHPLESAWRVRVQPKWGDWPVGEIRHSDVRRWIVDLSSDLGPTSVIRAHGILAGILDVALRDRRLSDNPARGIRLPKKRPKNRVYLSHTEVRELADRSIYPELIYVLAYTGLRWGEATALRVRDVQPDRRRLTVYENAVIVNGTIHVGSPKTHRSRSVPYPEFLDGMFRSLASGKSIDELLFGNGTEHMKLPNSKAGWFAGAVRRTRADFPEFPHVTPHDLRHTAASLAISAGANVKAVQRMLGHASAVMTLDTYADLFDDDLNAVSTAMHKARIKSLKKQRDRD
ncbi:tyrosine-type recombinase/integrase [Microbacter sp. GSS18]|nr:tyrosine-type recombinase/integrase [Microbacter sp. GSS18]